MYKPKYARKRTLTVKPDGIIKEKINVVQDWLASTQYIGGTSIQQRANFLWGTTVGVIPMDNVFAINKNNVQFKQ